MAKKIEYIRRDKAIHYAQWEGAYKVVMYIEEMKSEDVQPIKRGDWLIDDDRIYIKCTYCKEILLFKLINGAGAWKGNAGLPPFCPCCGADMRDKTKG